MISSSRILMLNIVHQVSCGVELLTYIDHSLWALDENLGELKLNELPNGKGSIEFGLHLVDDEEIKNLNGKHRKRFKVTDVLSFPVHENLRKKIPKELIPLNLGDIMICLPQAERQAHKHKISFSQEVTHLLVHGFLHLFGFDHEEDGEACIMFDLEEKLVDHIYQKCGWV